VPRCLTGNRAGRRLATDPGRVPSFVPQGVRVRRSLPGTLGRSVSHRPRTCTRSIRGAGEMLSRNAADHGHEWPGKPSPTSGGRAPMVARTFGARPTRIGRRCVRRLGGPRPTSVLRRPSKRGWGDGDSLRVGRSALSTASVSACRGRSWASSASRIRQDDLGETVVRLLRPTTGSVMFSGTDTASLDRSQSAAFRRRVQMIFQDPYSSFSRG